ncbi:hypothetical protein [Nocardia brasiliensis]|nr:hypothetical protein [Nocardia brasiliensis]
MSLPTLERSTARVANGRVRVQRPVVAPELRIGDNPAAAVLRAATGGPV